MTARTPTWADADLRAYLAGESADDMRRAIDLALETDDHLEQRLMALDEFGRSLPMAFEPLLAAAPAAELERRLEAATIASRRRDAGASNERRWALTGIAAAIAGAFGVGLWSGRGILSPAAPVTPARAAPASPSDPVPRPWFEAVADYVSLFSARTFEVNPLDASAQARGLRILGERMRLDLSGLGRIDRLRLQRAELLQLTGKPLGQIAYLDAADQPLVICIIVRPTPPGGFPPRPATPTFKTVLIGDLLVVHWDIQPYGFLVAGRQSEAELRDLANLVQTRVRVV